MVFDSSRSSSSRAAISSAASYPSQPASRATLRRTISDSLAVASWLRLCIVLRLGVESDLDLFDAPDKVTSAREVAY